MHHYRAEHWVVVAVLVKVTNNEKTYLCWRPEDRRQSTYIILGQDTYIHSPENPVDTPLLEMIEVQNW